MHLNVTPGGPLRSFILVVLFLFGLILQKVLQQVTVNEIGHYSFNVDMQKNYKVMAEKENYFKSYLLQHG